MSDQNIPPWAVEIKQIKARLEEKLESYHNIREKAHDADNLSQRNKERIEDLEENQTWLWRTVVGGIVLGAIGLLFFVVQLTLV